MSVPTPPDRRPVSLPTDQTSGAGHLLHELRIAHEAVREAIDLKLEVARALDFTASRCALVRWKMSRARHHRSKSLAATIAELLNDASSAEAAALHQLRVEELAVSRCCAAHLQDWTVEAIAQDRKAYASAAAQFCGAISDRLKREGDILYPMLIARIVRRGYAPKELATRDASVSSTVS